jgi:molecular chaperone IbpA
MENLDMRNSFDFTPYRRSWIGFDHLFDLMESATRLDQAEGYPPFDVEQKGEDAYRISLAVAGFTREDVEITTQPNLLVVAGRKKDEEGRTFLHRGIAARTFERQFQLADHVVVTSASLVDGMLEIDLKHELPDEVKPRRIEIGNDTSEQKRLTSKPETKQAA